MRASRVLLAQSAALLCACRLTASTPSAPPPTSSPAVSPEAARPRTERTVRALGLHRMHDTVVKDDRPEIRGMVAKVSHLVRMEEVDE